MLIFSKPKDHRGPNNQVVVHPRKQIALDKTFRMSSYQSPWSICWGIGILFEIGIESLNLALIFIEGEPNRWP